MRTSIEVTGGAAHHRGAGPARDNGKVEVSGVGYCLAFPTGAGRQTDSMKENARIIGLAARLTVFF
jgi:hypothetical protein